MDRITERFEKLKVQNEKAIIPFLMGSMPNENLSIECIVTAEKAGADIIEIGVPYSDPLADGEVIEKVHHEGVKKGLNLPRIINFINKLRGYTDIPLVLFSYYNPVYRMGIKNFASACHDNGIDSVIIPDLPLEELLTIQELGLSVIPLVAPSSSNKRLEILSQFNSPFIYCVSIAGTTGVRDLDAKAISIYLNRVQKYTSSPLALGFGISSPKQIKGLYEHADGFIIGSYLVNITDEYQHNPDEMLLTLGKTIRDLKYPEKNI
ncbi:MAG: tryptophan synthase subunit alpha [Syntrophomonadaceae bacterium]|nr:tryptophan synthase subunit alpha [Syntrophomonadaceae bacterium]